MYKVKLTISGQEQKAEGETLADALGALEVSKPNTKGTLTVTKGKSKVERLLYVHQLRRLFANRITRQVMAKYLETGLK